MAVRLYRHHGDIYLSGAGTTGCLCWRRRADRWVCAAAHLPGGAESIGIDALPADLREELLAFTARAEAMGGAAMAPSLPN